ncbi:MAG: hypothetical protein E5Y16_16160 [Mesorhizobium sp.]|nr:MAG: hypothetical protein E5Y45_00345 [Mesorhizobium sp.]TIM80454.1 MAG: hypothetical protein E5Y41_00055 [Mesorhizobium sp.]TIP84106.1 MAG: hypothetical protein E5X60_31785 [Mesorhizobium sp.]TJV37132.1 MAG: hypothetical protein E5Y16_16160 [Mesorhizobium sp.]TJX20789.1 MAG: hypothetical protein E5W21_34235 [Mesorhizobium sp.]
MLLDYRLVYEIAFYLCVATVRKNSYASAANESDGCHLFCSVVMLAKGFKRIPDLKGMGINNWLSSPLLVQSVLAQDNPDSIPENLTPAVSSGHVPETEMSARLPS